MTDYISRGELVDTLDECIAKCEEMLPLTPAQVHEMKGEINATKAIRVFVKRFPAADVRKVKRGEWLPTHDANKVRCSNCDVIHLIAQYPHGDINFCPNCGASMLDGEEQT